MALIDRKKWEAEHAELLNRLTDPNKEYILVKYYHMPDDMLNQVMRAKELGMELITYLLTPDDGKFGRQYSGTVLFGTRTVTPEIRFECAKFIEECMWFSEKTTLLTTFDKTTKHRFENRNYIDMVYMHRLILGWHEEDKIIAAIDCNFRDFSEHMIGKRVSVEEYHKILNENFQKLTKTT